MAIKRCASCAHWGARTEDDPELGSAITGQIRGLCQRITDQVDADAYSLAALAATYPEAGPWLLTSPDFGCAAWERKPEGEKPRAVWTQPDLSGRS